MTNFQQFKEFAREGEQMDALVALDLLIKAYISECGRSIGMRTLVYSAAEIWLYWRLPFSPDNPLSMKQIEKEPLIKSMPILCKEFILEKYGEWDITGGFDEKRLKNLCVDQIDRYDDETMKALCWGIDFYPKAIKFYWDIEDFSDEEQDLKIQKKREQLQKQIEKRKNEKQKQQ